MPLHTTHIAMNADQQDQMSGLFRRLSCDYCHYCDYCDPVTVITVKRMRQMEGKGSYSEDAIIRLQVQQRKVPDCRIGLQGPLRHHHLAPYT